MKFSIPTCPSCGAAAAGTSDLVPGVALLTIDADGNAEYSGETQMDWNGQRPKIIDGELVLRCHEGHEWQSPCDEETGVALFPPRDALPPSQRPAAAAAGTYIVQHYWGGDEPTVYLVHADHAPTEGEVAAALSLDYEPDNGEHLEINRIDVTTIGEQS